MAQPNQFNVIVLCTACGAVAPWSPPNVDNPWGAYQWHQPCPQCGKEAWAAHETTRDWRTGKLLSVDEER